MRASLGDLLIIQTLVMTGSLIGYPIWAILPEKYVDFGGLTIALLFCAALICPVYRYFKIYPMLMPRCPCCDRPRGGYYFQHGWPRILFKCPACEGEFVVWLNGRVGDGEDWERPVLVLRWPYVFGHYKRVGKTNRK